MRQVALNVAVVGIGGFAEAHHVALRELEQAGRVRVLAVCDPLCGALEGLRLKLGFRERGVVVYSDFEAMMQAHGGVLDLVDIVSPIRFHADHHRACVERGIACYLEKPPTLNPDELERMIAVETRARRATQVGFNHIGQEWRQQLKARVVAGEFGRVRRVAFKGLWRRSQAYYERNTWAGRLMLGDFILLDSCCGNAMAHHLHNLLFHAGTAGVMSWAHPETVEAELYRANGIEGTDTVFARGILDNGVEFHLVSTHACEDSYRHVEVIDCEHARIEIPEAGAGVILRGSKVVESFDTGNGDAWALVKENLRGYCDYLIGRKPRPATLLRDTRPFVHLNAMLYLAAGNIGTVDTPHAARLRMGEETRDTLCIAGIGKVCDAFIVNGRLPSEAALPWSSSGGSAREGDGRLAQLTTVLRSMCRRHELIG